MGLAISPHWAPPGGLPQAAIALVLILVALGERGRFTPVATVLVLLAAILAGTAAGSWRISTIDGGALKLDPGTELEIEGFTTGVVRHSQGMTRVPVQAEGGRIMIESARAPPGIPTGSGIVAEGVARNPPDFFRGMYERQGIHRVLRAGEIRLDGDRRGGLSGWVDSLRRRAEEALGRGMPTREAALARGFVLGQDDAIPEVTKDDFQASGLAHLLAVSGQNIVLLGLLAIPFMALAGFGPRTRLVVVAGLILIYVPLTGAGASIQRAGVMGLAGLIALAATRPASRLYALALAATVTLALNPRAGSDIGWQLSFAAVIGIYLMTGPLQARLSNLIGRGGWRTALVDGIAVTVAATMATAPLMAFHFERFPVTTLLANLLALPAVAPAMWLGMVSAALGQLGGWMALPFNLLNAPFLAYIAQVAAWCGGPSWAQFDVKVGGPLDLLVIYLAVGIGCVLLLRLTRPRNPDEPEDPRRRRKRISSGVAFLAAVAAALVLLPAIFGDHRRHLDDPPPGGARIEVLDVGQGDAILIRPRGGDPVLIDGGPPGEDIEGALESADVDRLAAVVLTHRHLDHFGGLYDVFGHYPVGHFLFDEVPLSLVSEAKDSGTAVARVSSGESFDFGGLGANVLWPPPKTPGAGRAEDPNTRSVVIELEVGGFRMLLTGDGEAEAAPVDPGPLDVLKVAHHGSDDAGLPALLSGSDPALALISVGDDNSYGHPTAGTMSELGEAGTEVLRTDQDGTISIVVSHDGYSVESGH
ncbi:MAG: ComEC/Rec2 family competence protein [Solirubrobacterales bacterium]|nr:ComEC/Rec2 family competence protein [Solirubrobacterales bacterium]